MTEIRELMALSAPWWVLHRDDEDAPWQREPLIGWGLVVDQADGGEPMSYVAGLVVDRDGATVAVAPPGRYVDARTFAALGACSCERSDPAPVEPGWCRRCACEVPS